MQERQTHPHDHQKQSKIYDFQFSKAISKVCGFRFSQEISKVCDDRFSKLCLVLHPSISPVCWAVQTIAQVQESHFVGILCQSLFYSSDLVLAAADDAHGLALVRVTLDILEKRHSTKTTSDENDTRRKRHSTIEIKTNKYSYSTCKQLAMMAGTSNSAPATAAGTSNSAPPATVAGPATAAGTSNSDPAGPKHTPRRHSSVVPATRKTTSRPCFRIGSQK